MNPPRFPEMKSFEETALQRPPFKWRQPKILFGVAVLLAFLPGWLPFLFFSLGIGIGLVKFLIPFLSRKREFSAWFLVVVGFILFTPACVVLFVLLFVLLVGGYPTLINFWAAYLVSGYAKKRWLRMLIFIIAAPILGLSYRLLPMTEDVLRGVPSQKTEIIKVVELDSNEALNIHAATETASWRAVSGDFLSVGGSEGSMSVYWVFPGQTEENIRTALQESGFRYKMNGKGEKRLEVEQQTNNGLMTLKLTAWEGDKKTASYEGLFRNAYGSEQMFYASDRPSTDSLKYRLLYLASANLWNKLAGALLPKPPSTPMKKFIEQAFKINPPVETESKSTPVLATMITAFPRQDDVNLAIGKMQEVVNEQCQGKIDLSYRKMNFLSRGEEFLVLLEHWPRIVRCTDTSVYVITQRERWKNAREEKPREADIYLTTYSLRGERLMQIAVELKNHPPLLDHSKLENFVETENSYQVEISEFELIRERDLWNKSTSIWSIPKAEPVTQ